jgi:hypothetical protein
MKTYGGVDVSIHVFTTLASRPGRFNLETEPPVPIGQETGWAQEPVCATWKKENSWYHRDSNSDPSVVQPVASRYTDCAIPASALDVGRRIILKIDIRGVGWGGMDWIDRLRVGTIGWLLWAR